ncbi:DUF3105 domain-containing protein [Nocardioides montaniterrae]
MAKPNSASSDRQKVINDLRRKQKRSANMQGTLILAVCIAIALGVIAVVTIPIVKNKIEANKWKGKDLASVGSAASVCQPVKTHPANGVQQHVDQGVTVTYDTAPPAYGKHWNVAGLAPAPIDQRFYSTSEALPLEVLVHNLEHGYTILWYDDTIAKDPKALDEVKGIASILDANDTNNRLSFKATPWLSKYEKQIKGHAGFPAGEHIAFTHWTAGKNNKALGVWQYCSAPSGAALKKFMADYPYTDAPEPIGGVVMQQ